MFFEDSEYMYMYIKNSFNLFYHGGTINVMSYKFLHNHVYV